MSHEDIVTQYCAHRSIDNRNSVVAAYWHLCLRGARKFSRAANDRRDLEQVAAVGLIKAAQNYRSDADTPFQAYAWVMVVGELMHYVRDHERIVRIPRALRSLERRYVDAWDHFCSDNQREPTNAEMAAVLTTSVRRIEELISMRRPDRVTLTEGAAGEEGMRWDLLADRPSGPSLDERLSLAHALDRLADRERTIVLGTYASGLTQSELAARLGLSQSRVSKILARTLVRLGQCVA